jgi:hypothetical protein
MTKNSWDYFRFRYTGKKAVDIRINRTRIRWWSYLLERFWQKIFRRCFYQFPGKTNILVFFQSYKKIPSVKGLTEKSYWVTGWTKGDGMPLKTEGYTDYVSLQTAEQPEDLVDLDMENSSVSEWTALDTAVLTKEGGAK